MNAATFLPSFLAPGQIISIFGSGLGPKDGVAATLDPATQKLPVSLVGTRVTFDGVTAPLIFIRNDQINLQVPFELAGRSSARMAISGDGLAPAPTSPPFPAPVLPASVTMNAIEARVVFAGPAPGFVGVTQLNVEIPQGLAPSSEVRVSVLFGSHPAPKITTIAVR